MILNPEWGTDAVYKVLDEPTVINQLGRFNNTDLGNIWNEAKYETMQPQLLELMLKFKLCYELPKELIFNNGILLWKDKKKTFG